MPPSSSSSAQSLTLSFPEDGQAPSSPFSFSPFPLFLLSELIHTTLQPQQHTPKKIWASQYIKLHSLGHVRWRPTRGAQRLIQSLPPVLVGLGPSSVVTPPCYLGGRSKSQLRSIIMFTAVAQSAAGAHGKDFGFTGVW